MPDADDALLDALEAEVLHPDVVAHGLRAALAELQQDAAADPGRAAARTEELRQVEQQMAHLMALVKMAGPSPAVAAEFKALERRRSHSRRRRRPRRSRRRWIRTVCGRSWRSGASGFGARCRSRGRCCGCSSLTESG
jgi:hypothetical protein